MALKPVLNLLLSPVMIIKEEYEVICYDRLLFPQAKKGKRKWSLIEQMISLCGMSIAKFYFL